MRTNILLSAALITTAFVLSGCGNDSPPPTPADYTATDSLVDEIYNNVVNSPELDIIADIDHSRLAAEDGASLSPSRVLIVSNPGLESRLLQRNLLIGLDLPIRVLAYEDPDSGLALLTWNRFDYLASRYDISALGASRAGYSATLDLMLRNIDPANLQAMGNDNMQPDGITTLDSPVDFDSTVERVLATIEGEEDALLFGQVDFTAQAAELGIDLPQARLILFGAPAPGARAMGPTPTLGLDAFCQKFLVWEGKTGQVYLSYNHLPALGERHGGGIALPLKHIAKRMDGLFGEALAE